MQTANCIDSATLINQSVIQLGFHQLWEQEDIKVMAANIFSRLKAADVIEHVTGADREYFRFRTGEYHFLLQFESYSNACWIEAEDEFSEPGITELLQQLLN